MLTVSFKILQLYFLVSDSVKWFSPFSQFRNALITYIPFVDQHDMNHYSEAKHNPGTMQTIFISQTITTNDITAKPITTQQNTFTANHKAVITIKHTTHDLSNSLHITRIRMNIDWNWKRRLLNRLTVYKMKNDYPLIWLISIMVAIFGVTNNIDMFPLLCRNECAYSHFSMPETVYHTHWYGFSTLRMLRWPLRLMCLKEPHIAHMVHLQRGDET